MFDTFLHRGNWADGLVLLAHSPFAPSVFLSAIRYESSINSVSKNSCPITHIHIHININIHTVPK